MKFPHHFYPLPPAFNADKQGIWKTTYVHSKYVLYRYLPCIYEYSRECPTSIKLNQVPRNRPEHCISAFREAETPYDEEEKDLCRYHPIREYE